MWTNIIAILIGIIFGIFCGIFPGLHPNSVGSIISLIGISNLDLILISLLGVYCTILFIPAIFFGIPDGQTQISLLPGQKMYLEGLAKDAIYIVAVSALLSAIISILVGYILMNFIEEINSILKPNLWFILILASTIFIIKGSKNLFFGFIFFILCGFYGYFVLNFLKVSDPLFAMFVGFFTLPFIFHTNEQKIIKQNQKVQNKKIDFLEYILAGTALGAIADFLPGISSPAQMAVFSSLVLDIKNPRNFLAHICSIEVSHNIFAIATAASGQIARVGTIAILKNFVNFNIFNYTIYCAVFLISVIVGVWILIFLSDLILRYIKNIQIDLIAKIVGIYLLTMIVLINGPVGLLISLISFLFGMVPYKINLPRTFLMSSLIVPSIIYALF
jgi:putative membrane protein